MKNKIITYSIFFGSSLSNEQGFLLDISLRQICNHCQKDLYSTKYGRISMNRLELS